MDLETLELFVEVMRHGSFADVARDRGAAPSSITNSQAIKQCAIARIGLTLLPDWLINDALASGELVTVFSEYVVTATDFESAIWILYPSWEYLPLKSRVFVDFLLRKFGKS
jgi:DNA-binding transcriptional LysR family regulator